MSGHSYIFKIYSCGFCNYVCCMVTTKIKAFMYSMHCTTSLHKNTLVYTRTHNHGNHNYYVAVIIPYIAIHVCHDYLFLCKLFIALRVKCSTEATVPEMAFITQALEPG